MGKMRQIFVALVSLYVGLVYGFIVPSGGSEEKTSTDLYEIGSISNYTKLKKNILNKRMESSLLNDYNIDKYHQNEKDLFEHIKEKENNVSERSLILLSQKIKKTLLNKLFNNKHKTWPSKYEDEFPLNQLMAFQKPKDTEKTYFQPNIGTKIPKVYEPVDCLIPNHRCNKENEIEGVYDDNNDQMQIATEADVKGDRVRLFKPCNDSIKSFINKVKDNDYKDNENNRFQIKTPMNIKPTDYMSKYELLQPINKVLFNKLQYRTYTNDIPNGRPVNKEDKLYRIKVDKKMNLRVDSSEEKSVPSISYSKNCNHHPLCSKVDGHHINNAETAQNRTCKCSVTQKKETKQKELNSFSTQESRLEDTYMDQFLDILRA